jgi:AcrR family transcriptional regulator
MDGIVGRRERKKQQVRQALIEQAFRLFDERGFEAVTIENVTEAADVSRTTFFRYFASKEEVLLAWMRGVGDEVARAVRDRPAEEGPVDAVRHALTSVAGAHADDSRAAALVERLRQESAAVHSAYREKITYWEDALTDAVAERTGHDARTALEPRLLARFAMAAVTSTNDTWAERGHEGDPTELLMQGLSMLPDPFAPGPTRPTTGADGRLGPAS